MASMDYDYKTRTYILSESILLNLYKSHLMYNEYEFLDIMLAVGRQQTTA